MTLFVSGRRKSRLSLFFLLALAVAVALCIFSYASLARESAPQTERSSASLKTRQPISPDQTPVMLSQRAPMKPEAPAGLELKKPGPSVLETMEAEKFMLVVGKSILVTNPRPLKRVSIAAPEIADIVIIPPRQIYLTGKASGITNVTIWENEAVASIFDVEVIPDVSRLKEKLSAIFPEEDNLRIVAAHDSISLSGTVSSAVNASRVIELASAYAPKEKVINLLHVAGVQQVMLEVRVAEMSRSLMNRLGFNFSYVSGNDFGVSLLDGLTSLVKPDDGTIGAAGAPFGHLLSPSVNALFRFHKGRASWTGFIDALKEDGLLKILAEPTLIAMSGQTSNFLAGGEFPIPVPQGLGTVAIEYKPFGVGLTFTPTVLGPDLISIKVAPEVSELDFSIAVSIQGFLVPGLTTRRTSTTIELADGQSFAIAGLLKDTVRENIQKFPLLGDIPILGALFRSSEFQKNESELLIIVTPHLVRPLDMAKQTLPTDGFVEPNDAAFFLLGVMEGSEKLKMQRSWPVEKRGGVAEGVEGDFGHITQ